MHARTNRTIDQSSARPHQQTRLHPELVSIENVKAGATFMRLEYHGEVLAPLSYGGSNAPESERLWAVVVAVNHDSAGFVVGQLVPVKRGTHVRLVHEVRSPIYALEQ